MRLFFLAATLVVAACGADTGSGAFDDPTSTTASSSSGGAAPPTRDAGIGSSGATGNSDAAAPLPTACEGACREMTLVVSKNGVAVPFDRAQFGFDYGSSLPKLTLAAYQGGDESCPSPSTTQPLRALRIESVPAPLDTGAFESGSGIVATLFDFQGDVVSGTTVLEATRVDVSPTAASLDAASGEAFFAFDLHVEFAQGITADGHAFAAHCTSIDEP